MTTPGNFTLRIASEPTDDDAPTKLIAPIAAEPPKPASKKHSRRSGVQRLMPDEMATEIDRINRANGNGKPSLAEGTQADLDDE